MQLSLLKSKRQVTVNYYYIVDISGLSTGQNLLSMWTSRLKSQHGKRHVEFAGRAENPGSLKAELYIHLKEEDM
jgi:hypothetical protein